jgi:hypothetical protein
MDADLSMILDKLIVAFKDNGCDPCVMYHHVRGALQQQIERSETPTLENQLHTPIPIVPQESGAHTDDGVTVNKTCEVNVNDCTAVAISFSAMSNVILPDNEQVHNMQSLAKSHQQHLGVEDTQDLMIGCS